MKFLLFASYFFNGVVTITAFYKKKKKKLYVSQVP